MGRRIAALAAVLLFVALAANAQDISRSIGTAATNYSLDGLTAPTRAYGFRRLLTSYSTNKLIRLVRASDSTQSDIGFTATGALDVATATTFCNATTCKVVTIYDQSGAAGDITQATDGNRPAYTTSCLGTNPCARFDAVNLTAAGNITPATGLMSFSVVGNRSVGTASCVFVRGNGSAQNRLVGGNALANRWQLVGGTSGSISNTTATDAAWHAAEAVLNGASSVITIDGSEVTGTATGSTTAGTPAIAGIASTTCDTVEMVIWDNYGLTASERTRQNGNQRAWWGF